MSGWAAERDTGRAPAGMCVVDGAGGNWTAPCDVPRADVRSAWGGAEDRFGFEIAVPTDGLDRGEQTVVLWPFDEEGRRLGRPVEASFEVALPVRLFPGLAEPIDEPAPAQAFFVVSAPPPATNRASR